jgi:hypothetical protein
MNISRNDLVKALKLVLPGVDKKGEVLLEGANTFVFDNDWIKTFNDHLSVSFKLKTGINCAVKAEELYNAVSKMSGLMLDLNVTEEHLTIKDPTTELTMMMAGDSVGKYIDSFDLQNLEWADLPRDFIEGVKQCLFSAANKPDFGILNAIFIGGSDIISSDNFRISWYTMDSEVDKFLLPLGAAKELCKVPNLTKICVGEAWAHFTDESGVTFSARLFLGEYPAESIAELFEGDAKSKYSFPEESVNCLDRTNVLSFSDPNGSYEDYVLVREEKGYLIFKGERSYGSIQDKVKIPAKSFPPNIELKISPRFLQSILHKSRQFQLKNDSLIVFKTDKYKHLIATAM